MDVAIFHDQPPHGGVARVLAEYVGNAAHHRFTVYSRRADPIAVGDHVQLRLAPVPQPRTQAEVVRYLLSLPAAGRRLAARIDAGGHDVVFAFASELSGAPEVLPYLRTPSLYYVPEQIRALYDDQPEWLADRSIAGRLAARGFGPTSFLRKRADRRHIRGADRVVTHSHWTAHRLREVYGVVADVVHLGVDAERFTPGSGSRRRSVLSVGALHPLKGHQFVVEAVATMPEPRPPVVVVGDRGFAAGPLQQLADRCGVELELRQQVPFAELVGAYREAGVLACGQFEEPFGLIVLEAHATGTPVVAVAEGGFRETVEDGVDGLLIGRNARRFGAAIGRVLDDESLASRLGHAGRRAAQERWTWERTVAGYDRLLEAIASPSVGEPDS